MLEGTQPRPTQPTVEVVFMYALLDQGGKLVAKVSCSSRNPAMIEYHGRYYALYSTTHGMQYREDEGPVAAYEPGAQEGVIFHERTAKV